MGRRPSHIDIFIDASSFAQPRKSGIGHIAEELSDALRNLLEQSKNSPYTLNLVVSLGKAKYLAKFKNMGVNVKTVPLPYRAIQLLLKLNLLPPLDVFLGKGIYIFPNYRNWPLAWSKSMTYIHDLTYLKYPEFTEPKNLMYLTNNVPAWVKRADVVVTGSEFTKDELIDDLKIDPDKIKVVYHGVESETIFIRKSLVKVRRVLKKYGIYKTDFILHVGNIEPRKNIVGLIRAYELLSDSDKKAHPLVLVGGGGWSNEAELAAIEESIKKGNVIIRPEGYVDDADLPYFYSAASLLVMPSFYEGFGLPPLQAAACGTPIVVSENSSLTEIFKGTAVFVDAESTESIYGGMVEALHANAVKSATYKANAKMLVNQFKWSRTASSILSDIEELYV